MMVSQIIFMSRKFQIQNSSHKIPWIIIGTILSISSAYSLTANTCTTPGCLKAAAQISDSMDSRFHPCDNFYQFSCGGYFNKTKVPKYFDTKNKYNDTISELLQMTKVNIEKNISASEPRTFKLLQSYYNSCMNAETIRGESEKREILKILNNLGGWPVLVGKSWNSSTFKLNDTIYKIRKMGFGKAAKSFADFHIDLFWKDSRTIGLGGALTNIDKEYSNANSSNSDSLLKVEQYFEKMIRYAEILGADPVQARTELTKSLEFEKQLARISDDSYGLYQFEEELYKPFPEFPWLEYLEEYLTIEDVYNNGTFQVNSNGTESKINNYVISSNFLLRWVILVATTPEEVLANYAIWRVVEELIDLSEELADEKFERSHTCIIHLHKSMPLAVGAFYVRNNFNKTLKTEVEHLTERVRESYKHVISEAKWMNDLTKNKAIQKVDSMYATIAYPDEYLDNEKLDNYHKNLTFATENYYESSFNLMRFQRMCEMKKAKGIDNWATIGTYATMSAIDVDALNMIYNNSIYITAGLIRHEYIADGPNYLNYATMGYTIGHEMTHGFDDDGLNHNSSGRYWDWFEQDLDAKLYHNKTFQCIKDQFSKYRYVISNKSVPFDSEKKLRENIADIGGIQVAYRSYEEWINKNGEEPGLPGLETYTPRQLFWIGSASEYCTKTKVSGFNQLLSQSHSPYALRVIGTFVNMPEFARDFQCKPTTRMNPNKRCILW